MRLSWGSLSTWQGALEVASSLHENDGFPRKSPSPAPTSDACLAPTPMCVDSGIAFKSGGKWFCSAPSWSPPAYGEERCPARSRGKALKTAQVSKPAHSGATIPDEKGDKVRAFVKKVLIDISVGKDEEMKSYALNLLLDWDKSVSMEVAQRVGEEIARRSGEERPWK